MENILLNQVVSDGIMDKKSIFSFITWLNGCICFVMASLNLLTNSNGYSAVLLFPVSLIAFFFFHVSKKTTVSQYIYLIFLFLYYVVLLPLCFLLTKLNLCELLIYFIVGIIFTSVILEGWLRSLLLAAEILTDIAAIGYTSFYLPDDIYENASVSALLCIRLLLAVAAAGLAGGILLKYRNNMLLAKIKSSRERSEKAENMNVRRNMFMANVTREISTPLNAIIDTTQGLLDMDLNLQRREDIFYIDNSGRNLLSAANELLNFAEKDRDCSNGKENSEKVYREIVNSIAHAVDQKAAEEWTGGKFICPDAVIMVVDDNIINIEILKSMLEPYRCRIISASGGRECLELLMKESADLIFLDYIMPEMDGAETLKQIRAQQEKQTDNNTPVIALTANADSGAKELFLSYGFDAYVTKPIKMDRLKQMLRQYLPQPKIIKVS